MTPTLLLVVSIAGGVGAIARYCLDGLITRRTTARVERADRRFPYGIFVVNVTGSLMLGLVAGLAAGQLLPDSWAAALGTGFLGGYTTFSTTSLDTADLLRRRRRRAAIVNGPGQLLAAVAAAGLGLLVGAGLARMGG